MLEVFSMFMKKSLNKHLLDSKYCEADEIFISICEWALSFPCLPYTCGLSGTRLQAIRVRSMQHLEGQLFFFKYHDFLLSILRELLEHCNHKILETWLKNIIKKMKIMICGERWKDEILHLFLVYRNFGWGECHLAIVLFSLQRTKNKMG
jgi:hypothetical protein